MEEAKTIEEEAEQLTGKELDSSSVSEESENKSNADEGGANVTVNVEQNDAPTFSGFRKRMMDRFSECGEDLSNDEVYDKYCNKYADDCESELKGYHDADNALKEIFEVYPEFKDLIRDISVDKVPPRVAIARQFSIEDLTPTSGDDDYEAYMKEWNNRKEGNKKQKDFEDMLYKNIGESNGKIDAFVKEKGYTDEQKQSLIDLMNATFDKSFNGITDNDMLEMFAKALMFEKAVEQAKAVGEIVGRNANIEAKMETSSKKNVGDGLPQNKSNQYQPKMVQGKKAVVNMGSILDRYK